MKNYNIVLDWFTKNNIPTNIPMTLALTMFYMLNNAYYEQLAFEQDMLNEF